MASPENLAKRRAVALNCIATAIIAEASKQKKPLRPFPTVSKHLDHDHQLVAIAEWIHTGLIVIGIAPEPPKEEAKPAALTPAAPPPEGGGDNPTPTPPEELQKLTKEQLLKLAADRNITTVKASNTKADIIAALTPAAPPPA